MDLVGESIPRANAGVNLHVLIFALCVSLACGLIFGIIPAITASRTDLVSSLKAGGRTDTENHDWLRPSLIVGQIALELMLTAGAGLLITSFIHLRRTNEGFNPDHVLTFLFVLPSSRYGETRPVFYREYFDKLRALPGVQSAGGTINLPMTKTEGVENFEDLDHPTPEGQRPNASVTTVSPEYFSTMQIPLIRGRDFSDRDDANAPPVMIVSRTFAQRYFPHEEVIGKKLRPSSGNEVPGEPPLREIVGDVRFGMTEREITPGMYVPAAQFNHFCCLYTVMRTRVDPRTLESTVRQLVASMDKSVPITEVNTMQELMFSQLSQPRFAMVLLGSFAGLALVLTILGLYGVMMYSVSRRTREIGIRMAMGAQRSLVLGMILREASTLLVIGITIGLAASLASASVLQQMLYGTGSRNPMVLTLGVVAVAVSGLIASYIPAFRAASIHPVQALRNE